MGTFLQHLLGESPWTPLLLVLIDAGLKGLVLLLAATLTTLAMQRSSAAARHLVWMLALVALLALPLVTWVAPQWQLAILPAPATTEVVTPPAAPSVSIQTPRAPAPDNSAVQEPSVPRSTTQSAPPAEAVRLPVAVPAVAATPPTTSTSLDAAPVLLLAWLACALLVLWPLVMGHIAVLRLQRRTPPFADGPLTRLTVEIAKTLGIRQPVRLHRVPSECMPMAAGVLRAAVFLPASAETWPETRQRVVLLHELAHVKRRDCLTHALARFAVALHWFNPLAWYALRQLRIEREHACDDLVLAAGERPADYAENLLEIARNFRAGRLTSAAAITMAKKSQLEGRLLAVLDVARRRGVPTPRVAAGLVLAAAAACAVIAACQLTPAEATGPLERVPFASGKMAQSQERNFAATYANGLQARLVGVGEPDGYTVSSVWAPDGAPLPGPPEEFKSKMGGSGSDKSGLTRRFFIEVFPVPEEFDLGIKFKVEGNSVAQIIDRSKNRRCVNVQIYNIPDKPGSTSLELGIAAGPWESVHGTNGPHSTSEGSAFGAAYSDFFEKDGKAHVVVTHTPREDDYRLVVYDRNDTPYPTREESSSVVGGMRQTEFVVEGDVGVSELLYMDFQARPYEWQTFSGIALSPDPSSRVDTEAAFETQQQPRLQVRLVAPQGQFEDASAVPWHDAAAESSDTPELWLIDASFIGQEDIEFVEVRRGHVDTDYALALTLKADAAKVLAKVTGENVGRKLAIVVDGKVLSAPTIAAPISGGPVMITGSFDRAAAEALAAQIRGDDAATEASTEYAGLGPIVEATVRHSGEHCLIDFDTGELHTPPDFNGTEEALAWMAAQGIDAGGGLQEEIRGLIGMDLIANPESRATWDTVETNGALNHDALTLGTPGNPVYLSAKGDLPATYTFKTREGGVGIVQILGFIDEEPRGVNIRYRMRLAAPPRAESADDASFVLDLRTGEGVDKFNKPRSSVLARGSAADTLRVSVRPRVPEAEATAARYPEPGIIIHALGRPAEWPQRWWNTEGVPVEADPDWQSGYSGKGSFCVVYSIANGEDSARVVLGHPDSDELALEARISGGSSRTTGERTRRIALLGSDLANYIEGGGQFDLQVNMGRGPWEEVASINVGETVEADGGTFHLSSAETVRKPVAFGVDEPWLVKLDGSYKFDPNWEIALVAQDQEGNRSPTPRYRDGWGMFDRPVERSINAPIVVAFEEVAHYVILKRPLVEYTIRDLPAKPRMPIDGSKEPQDTVNSIAPGNTIAKYTDGASDSPGATPIPPNPDAEAILAMLRDAGIDDVTHYHDMAEAWALEEVGLSCRPDSNGRLRLKGMPYAPRLLAFPGGTAPRDAMQRLRESPERLLESEEWTATLPFDALTLFAALNDKGETWFLLFVTDDTQCRNVYLWRSLEDQAILDARAWVDELMIPQDQLAWGEVNNGLQAAALLRSPKDAFPLNEAIPLAFVLRNASDTRIELLTSEWRDDYTVLATTPNNEIRESNASQGTGFRRVRRIKLDPGQVAEIQAASCAFVSEDYDWMSDGKITAALTTQPGLHKVRLAIDFPNVSMRSGKGAPQPGDWEGTLTTGSLELRIAEQRATGADAGPAAG